MEGASAEGPVLSSRPLERPAVASAAGASPAVESAPASAAVDRPTLTAEDVQTISRGGLLVKPSWLEPNLIDALRTEVRTLSSSGAFQRSGVATAGADGTYDETDRLVCILDRGEPASGATRLPMGEDRRSARGSLPLPAPEPEPEPVHAARRVVEKRLAALCTQLGVALARPSLTCQEQ
jgi:hypothetical protein